MMHVLDFITDLLQWIVIILSIRRIGNHDDRLYLQQRAIDALKRGR